MTTDRPRRWRAMRASSVGLVCLALAACSPASSASPSAAPSAAPASSATTSEAPASASPAADLSLAGTPLPALTTDPITLNFVANGDWPKGDFSVAEAFTKLHPNITVKFEPIPAEENDAFATRLGGSKDSTIDILPVDVPVVSNYSIRGFLAPLDEYFTAADVGAWTEVEQAASKYADKLMAPPVSSSSGFMYVNRDLFKEAGVTPPTGLKDGNSVDAVVADRWTWEKVEEAGKTIKAKTGKIGMQILASNDPYNTQELPDSLGGQPLSPDGLTATGYVDSAPWLKAATWFQNIFKNGASDPSLQNWDDQPFLAGNVGMVAGGDYEASNCAKATFDCDIVAFPYFEGGKVATPTGGWHLGVGAYSEHKAEAAEFIKFWSSEAGVQEYAKSVDLTPTITSLLEAAKTDPKYDTWPASAARLAAFETANNASPRASTPGWAEYSTIIIKMWSDIQNGTDPATALSSAATEIDGQLQKYR